MSGPSFGTWGFRLRPSLPQGPEAALQPAQTPPSRWLKAAMVFALLAITVFDRFGLQLSATYSIPTSLLAFYGLAGVMLLTGSAQIHPSSTLMVLAVGSIAGLSFAINANFDAQGYASLSSLLLLLVLYAPFVLSLRPAVATPALWRWFADTLVTLLLWIGVAGILQFYAQFVFRVPWLFDFTSYLPEAIRGSGVYNTVNHAGDLVKSNGFFLREASGFSWYMALGLVLEWTLKRRKLVMAVMALGIVVSYSGSGLLVLAVALLFPLGWRALLRVLGCVVSGVLVVVLLGDVLNLDYTLSRTGEIHSNKSSAYCRFISPAKLVAEEIDSRPWTTFLGHGSGTTQKMSTACETTFGKVLFEYGLLGAVAFGLLIFSAISRAGLPSRLRAMVVVQWVLLGGLLLAPDSLLLIFTLSAIWPVKVCILRDHPSLFLPARPSLAPSLAPSLSSHPQLSPKSPP